MIIIIIEDKANRNFGGAEKSMAQFCDYLLSNNYEIIIICNEYVTYESVKGKISVYNINTHPPKLFEVISYFVRILKIIKIVKNSKAEVLLTHVIHAFPIIRIVKLFTNIKTIVYFKWIYNLKSIGFYNKWGIAGIDKFISLNVFVKNYWQSQLKNKPDFDIVPDGVRFDSPVIKKEKQTFINLIYLGRIYHGKGLHVLINSLKLLGKNYYLTVLGEFKPDKDNYHNEISNLVNNLELTNQIFFVGQVLDVKYYLKNADLTIVPSILPESQPLAILESISLKIPAIASDIGGIPDIYNFNTFWLFKPNDTTSLFIKIKSIIELPPNEIKERMNYLYSSVYKKYNIVNNQKHLLSKILN